MTNPFSSESEIVGPGVNQASTASADYPRGPQRALRLADETYIRLRRDIIRGRLRPNEQLTEAELADSLNVSRTPIRESLQRLAADGLIVSRRRRWVVHEHTPDEVRDIYEVRLALEGYAAKLACERASDEEIQAIVDLDRSRRNIDELNHEEWVDFNDRFHQQIVAAAGNSRLVEFLDRNRQFYFSVRLASLYSMKDMQVSQGQHHRIAEAIRARDGTAAEAITREHIDHALRLILERLY